MNPLVKGRLVATVCPGTYALILLLVAAVEVTAVVVVTVGGEYVLAALVVGW